MRIIDLLNKIANGELREDVKINTRYEYCTIDEYFNRHKIEEDILNTEVIGFNDIIEENKKIQELDYDINETYEYCFGELYDKVNEIIEVINNEYIK